MDLPKGAISPKEYWTRHIEAAEKFNGSNKAYCKHAGIKYGSLSAYRKRLGFTSAKKLTESKFSTVELAKSLPVKNTPGLPAPEWLARFLKAWVQGWRRSTILKKSLSTKTPSTWENQSMACRWLSIKTWGRIFRVGVFLFSRTNAEPTWRCCILTGAVLLFGWRDLRSPSSLGVKSSQVAWLKWMLKTWSFCLMASMCGLALKSFLLRM